MPDAQTFPRASSDVSSAVPPAPRPDLTPIEATNKANAGAVYGMGGGSLGGAMIYLWSLTSAFPAEWAGDPQAMVAVTMIATAIFGAVSSWVGAYRASDKRFQ